MDGWVDGEEWDMKISQVGGGPIGSVECLHQIFNFHDMYGYFNFDNTRAHLQLKFLFFNFEMIAACFSG